MNKYIIEDMNHANSDSLLVKNPGKYALFPGCQLGAFEPELVVKLYDSLRNQYADMGIILACCGAPAKTCSCSGGCADDAEGLGEAFAKSSDTVKKAWIELGKPVFIITCPLCMEHLKEVHPDIQTKSIYDFLLEQEISGGCHEAEFTVYEDCGAFSEAVRTLADDMGGDCDHDHDHESADASSPAGPTMLTCTMQSRNKLLSEGQSAQHILELVYGNGEPLPAAASEEEIAEIKKQNRLDLKEALLNFFFS